MTIRPYCAADIDAVLRLFFETVHTVAAADYTEAQLRAWASGHEDPAAWNASLLAQHALVAVEQGEIIGFGDAAPQPDGGLIDRLYVHRAHQRRGVASALLAQLEALLPPGPVTVFASKTARPFFEHHGYRVVRENIVERRGERLLNYCMRRHAPATTPQF